jgi:hypothetical protein
MEGNETTGQASESKSPTQQDVVKTKRISAVKVLPKEVKRVSVQLQKAIQVMDNVPLFIPDIFTTKPEERVQVSSTFIILTKIL